MDSIKTYRKYINLIPKIKHSNKSLRELSRDLNLSINTISNIKKAIKEVEKDSKVDYKKSIRFTRFEIELIGKRAKEEGLNVSDYIRKKLFE